MKPSSCPGFASICTVTMPSSPVNKLRSCATDLQTPNSTTCDEGGQLLAESSISAHLNGCKQTPTYASSKSVHTLETHPACRAPGASPSSSSSTPVSEHAPEPRHGGKCCCQHALGVWPCDEACCCWHEEIDDLSLNTVQLGQHSAAGRGHDISRGWGTNHLATLQLYLQHRQHRQQQQWLRHSTSLCVRSQQAQVTAS